MITARSRFRRLAVTMSIVFVLLVIMTVTVLGSSDKPLARAGELDASELAPSLAGSLTPQPPPRLDPPITTSEPGAAQANVGSRGSSDLEAVRFRPDITLRRGDALPGIAALKSSGASDSRSPKRPQGTAGPQAAYQAPDIEGVLGPLDWNPELYEDFEGVFPSGQWALFDFSDDGYTRTWGTTDFAYYAGFKSAWPAAGGADALDPWVTTWYTDNLYSWMEYGPFDFSGMADVFVGFGLYYDTEPNYDWIYFCASTDAVNYNCDYWSGYSDGWTDQAYWLTSYAGYSQVWLAWVFISDDSISDGFRGPYVDEITVWSYTADPIPPPEPGCDLSGQLAQNCSFETGDLTGWGSLSPLNSASGLEDKLEQRETLPVLTRANPQPDSSNANPNRVDRPNVVAVTDATSVEGLYSAYLWQPGIGNDFLFQTLDVPTGTTDIALDFWFAVTTDETNADTDWFCASLSNPAAHNDIWVDLGCVDAVYTTGEWQEVLYTLSAAEVAALAGPQVDIVFELYNRGADGSGTAGWLDFIRVYASGGSGSASIDPYEPNDDPLTQATTLACGQTISGTIGGALSDYGDVDWFVLSNVPSGQVDLDITADTQVPPSALDSVVGLWDSNAQTLLASNDDDGLSYDSYVTYTNPITGSTLYVSVESYSGYGGPDSFYDLDVLCAGAGSGPPPAATDLTTAITDTWTIMLYLNAEDRSFEPILKRYIADMQTALVGKTSFMTVAVLYDGPGMSDTVRYLLQPSGNYVDGVNRWPMGELNMGDPDTLARFANWALDQFPTENTYLAIDDHGHGVFGISWDRTNGNDNLTPPEVYSALKDATRNGDRRIDIFDYEACLMGMAENAYDVREWIEYVVFSEQISWGLNTYPVYFSNLTGVSTTLQVGQRIIDRYSAAANAAGYPHTISLIDTGQMAGVKQAVTDLGNALVATANITDVTSARNASQAFAADNDATNPALADYIDLWDLADKTSGLSGVAAAATQVKNAVTSAVIAERHASGVIDGFNWNHAGAHGLSIYYPATNASSAFRDYTAPRLFNMSADESGIDGRWDEFLLWAVGTGGGGTSTGLGGGDRRGLSSTRFLQPKLGGATFVYLPLVSKQ